MVDMTGTAIVVPCYNEGLRLNPEAFTAYLEKNNSVHFIFVDDGSTDQTGLILEKIRGLTPERVSCLALGKNRGKSAAVREGVLAATARNFDIIGYWDADLSTPLDTIIEMRNKLECSDYVMVIGARVRLLGHEINRKAIRHYLGRFFATYASLVLGLSIYDTQCGAKIFKNNADLRLAFQEPFHVKWSFDVELIGRLELIRRFRHKSSLAFSASEYPLPKWQHKDGSKVKPKDFFIGLYELTKIWLLLRVPYFKKKYGDLFIPAAPSLYKRPV